MKTLEEARENFITENEPFLQEKSVCLTTGNPSLPSFGDARDIKMMMMLLRERLKERDSQEED
jgi:hypothetical protein